MTILDDDAFGTVSFSTQGTAGDVLYGTAAPITLGGGIVSGGLHDVTGYTMRTNDGATRQTIAPGSACGLPS